MRAGARLSTLRDALAPLVLASLVASAACGEQDTADGPPPEAAPGGAAVGTDAGAADGAGERGLLEPGGARRITGEFLVGPDRRDFLPCEGGSDYWVDGPALTDLMTLVEELTLGIEPYESIFVDLTAHVDPPPSSGPGASLAGTVLAMEVHRASFEGSCRSTDADIAAVGRGNEPFWQLRATRDGVRFETPEGGWDWSAEPLRPSPEGWVLTGTTHLGAPFTLTLEMGGCRDTMADAWYHLSSALNVDGRLYEGCGWLGPAAAR
jgi:uncharacterized membrane protein